MINWEQLYRHLLETKQQAQGEKHHIKPKHDGGTDADGLVVLPHRYHILAHYIRYRWLKQPGDSLAYKMMSGLVKNPMHDPVAKAAHAKKMRSLEHRKKLIVPKSDSTKAKFKEARKAYIEKLEDRSVLTAHMKTEECKAKRISSFKKYMETHPEKVKEWQRKSKETLRERNKALTKTELSERYGQHKTQNGKWRGYLILEKPKGAEIHATITDAIKHYGVSMATFLKYIKTGESFKKGVLKGCKAYLTKEV